MIILAIGLLGSALGGVMSALVLSRANTRHTQNFRMMGKTGFNKFDRS